MKYRCLFERKERSVLKKNLRLQKNCLEYNYRNNTEIRQINSIEKCVKNFDDKKKDKKVMIKKNKKDQKDYYNMCDKCFKNCIEEILCVCNTP